MCAILLGLFIGGDDRWPPKPNREKIVSLNLKYSLMLFEDNADFYRLSILTCLLLLLLLLLFLFLFFAGEGCQIGFSSKKICPFSLVILCFCFIQRYNSII